MTVKAGYVIRRKVTKRKGEDKMEWFAELAWYLKAALVAILAFLGFYFLV